MAQVRWTVGAVADLEDAADFLAAVSREAAASLVERILLSVARLETMPHLGRVVPEYQMERLRELIVEGHRGIYITDKGGDNVRIYAVHHGRRDLRGLLGEQPS